MHSDAPLSGLFLVYIDLQQAGVAAYSYPRPRADLLDMVMQGHLDQSLDFDEAGAPPHAFALLVAAAIDDVMTPQAIGHEQRIGQGPAGVVVDRRAIGCATRR
jgi:hypothetical protein